MRSLARSMRLGGSLQRSAARGMGVTCSRLLSTAANTSLTTPNTHSISTANSRAFSVKATPTDGTGKTKLVVVGSGWGATSFIKHLPKNISDKYDITMISKTNYFLYTPLLPAACTGTMEERSIIEPVRTFVHGKGHYYEAQVRDIDPQSKTLTCSFPQIGTTEESTFTVNYDALVLAVGSINNTFGIKGVAENCLFFKTIEDAKKLRRRISDCFERAALPNTSEEEKRKLLSFVVVGGGPTGVEVAAEVHDMVMDDLSQLYPWLKKFVEISIVDLNDHILSTYDRAISVYTGEHFKRNGIRLVLNSRVGSVEPGVVKAINKQNETTELPFGVCVWATGIAMNPLIKTLQPKMPNQTHFRSVVTDESLCVNGSNGSVWAVGDAATVNQPKAIEHAEKLFEKFDINKDNKLQLSELRELLNSASKEFSHFSEHARFLNEREESDRFSSYVVQTVSSFGIGSSSNSSNPLSKIDEKTELSKEEFKILLGKIDSGLRAMPATAQVARQQGAFLAQLFAENEITGDAKTNKFKNGQAPPFKYNHRGSAAYVGRDKAVFDFPTFGALTGRSAGVLWKSYETFSQFSLKNQLLVAADWLRTKAFGRDISRV